MEPSAATPLFHLGTGRAGSTFLYHLVHAHPQISLPIGQEIGFYTDYYQRGWEWYAAQFEENGRRVDTSPAYFVRGDECAPRIAHALQGIEEELRFIVILRNPVDFVHSHFLLRLGIGKFRKNPDVYPRPLHTFADLLEHYPDYFHIGQYHRIMEETWLRHFPRESFKFILFRDLIAEPQKTVDSILSFWGFEPIPVQTQQISRNGMLRHPWLYTLRSQVVKIGPLKRRLKESELFNLFYSRFIADKPPTLTTHERQLAWKYFDADVRELETFLDRDLSFWREKNLVVSPSETHRQVSVLK